MVKDEVVEDEIPEDEKQPVVEARQEPKVDPKTLLYQANLNDVDDYPNHLS